MLQVVHDAYQVLGLPRLTYYHHRLILRDVVGVQLGWVCDMELFEALEHFEEGFACVGSVVA